MSNAGDKKKTRCVCETLMLQKRRFFRNITLIFNLDLGDMTLTSWVLSKATCISNMCIIT